MPVPGFNYQHVATDNSFSALLSHVALYSDRPQASVLAVATRSSNIRFYLLQDDGSIDPQSIVNYQLVYKGISTSSIAFDGRFWALSRRAARALAACSDGCLRLFTCDFSDEDSARQNNYLAIKVTDDYIVNSQYIGDIMAAATLSHNGRLIVTDLDRESSVREVQLLESRPTDLSVSADGSLMFFGDEHGFCGLYDLRCLSLISHLDTANRFLPSSVLPASKEFWGKEQEEIDTAMCHDERITSSSIVGNLVFSGAANGVVKVWDVRVMRQLAKIYAHSGSLVRLKPMDGGRKVVTGGSDRRIRIWNWQEAEICHQIELEGRSNLFGFDEINKFAVVGFSDKRFDLFCNMSAKTE